MEEIAALIGITGVDTVFCVSETYTQIGVSRPRITLEVNCHGT